MVCKSREKNEKKNQILHPSLVNNEIKKELAKNNHILINRSFVNTGETVFK